MKIGLVLSGGGVLGIAHLGVLKALEEENIIPDIICGTSAGAIFGSLYAYQGIQRVENFVSDLKETPIFSKNNILTPGQIFKIIKLTLSKNILVDNFDKLQKKFICVVTDYISGKEVVIENGNIIEAVMASSSFPGVFPVYQINDQYYMDGGVVKNLPADILKNKEIDFIIGSSLTSVSTQKNPSRNPITVALRAINIMQKELSEIQEKICDFCFTPPIYNYDWYNTSQIDDMNQLGYNYAKRHIQDLKLKLEKAKSNKIKKIKIEL